MPTSQDTLDFPAIGPLLEVMTHCRKCPRLVAWRETVAEVKVKRHQDELYWGRPVPSFGDPNARLLLIGLAPAAQGGNRTGRMFTGDRSGDWLYRALYRSGFANHPNSTQLLDGLTLRDCYITASIHCAPPENKPKSSELANCRPYLVNELKLLKKVRVVIALGKLAFDTILKEPRFAWRNGEKKPQFGHGLIYELPSGIALIGSYHPSQQNTFTGRLTEAMFDEIFNHARRILDGHRQPS